MDIDAALPDALAAVQPTVGGGPFVGLILGSGLGAFADAVEDAARIPFAAIPHFPPATVEGHAGTLVAGTLEGVRCLVLQGRVHTYDAHAPVAVGFPVRLLVRLGLRALIVTNAAGAVNPAFRPGSLMLIDDHINLLWRNPLIGPVVPGEMRFPDMSEPYDTRLRALAERTALKLGIPLERGVYCAVTGPSYETAAEVRMLRRLGADAVGMSTVPEVIAARAAAVPALGLSLITNLGTGLSPTKLSHDEVVEAGRAVQADLTRLLRAIIREIGPAHA